MFSLPKIQFLSYAGIFFYITGFTILYIGRFWLGKNFRYGIANEESVFVTYGIYKISRNPMYFGLFLTLAGSVLYTFNILYLILALFISVVHHNIALNEEKELKKRFGNTFEDYCKRVRRYI
jgi:protein-S-isoprenylcysteine O-methyltransferase Ste14